MLHYFPFVFLYGHSLERALERVRKKTVADKEMERFQKALAFAKQQEEKVEREKRVSANRHRKLPLCAKYVICLQVTELKKKEQDRRRMCALKLARQEAQVKARQAKRQVIYFQQVMHDHDHLQLEMAKRQLSFCQGAEAAKNLNERKIKNPSAACSGGEFECFVLLT
jgi:hypothetical protein